jgi:GNAT superfamily N-acetyltransferase
MKKVHPHGRHGEALPDLAFHPLTADRWPDLEKLFGKNGACGGCWCMWLRLTRAEFTRSKGEGNREAFRAIVAAGELPGLLAYAGPEPVGWVAVAPRERHPVWDRSRNYKRIDDAQVWSISCFYVARGYRDRGLTRQLINAAVAFARTRGGRLVEGYPVDAAGPSADVFAWNGFLSAFEAAGFAECVRRSPTRPMVRLTIQEPQTTER